MYTVWFMVWQGRNSWCTRPSASKKATVDGCVAIFKSGIPLKCLGPTQHCFSECL
jgi:hypothetical protein